MAFKTFSTLTFVLAAMVATGAAAQSASVSAGGGQVTGSVKTPGAPPVSAQAGQGRTSVSPGPSSPGGQSVTVRSRDGSSSASAWTSGSGQSTVAGSGSPGSSVTVTPDPSAPTCPEGATIQYQERTGCVFRPRSQQPGAVR